MKKIIFLDIDGVLNSKDTIQRSTRGVIGIDPYLVALLNRIVIPTGAEIVLSSSWRHSPAGREEVQKAIVHPIIDITPSCCTGIRGVEIYKWIKDNIPHEERDALRYAILDDDSDMLLNQKDHFFQTSWEKGLTEEVAKRVIEHLNQTIK